MKTLSDPLTPCSSRLTAKARHHLLLTADELAYHATSYIDDDNLRHLALFLLHQAVRLNLTVLAEVMPEKLTQPIIFTEAIEAAFRFTPELEAHFPRTASAEKQLFLVFAEANDLTHSHTWPKKSGEDLNKLAEQVSAFMTHAERVYKLNRKRMLKVVS